LNLKIIVKKDILFRCNVKNGDVKIDNDEMQEYKWIKPKDGLKEKTDPYTHEFIKKYLEEL